FARHDRQARHSRCARHARLERCSRHARHANLFINPFFILRCKKQMPSFFEAITSNPLLLAALLAGIAASIVSGIIGSYVVVKRIVFIGGSISHSVLSGIGFCIWLERAQGITWADALFGALA